MGPVYTALLIALWSISVLLDLCILHRLSSTHSWLPNVQSLVHAHFRSISGLLGADSASCALEGEIPCLTSFCPCFLFLEYIILRTCHVRTWEWSRKRQLSNNSVKAGKNRSVLDQKEQVNCRGQRWALHPAWEKPPMNAEVCKSCSRCLWFRDLNNSYTCQ